MATERVDIYVEGHDGLSKPLAESNKSLGKLEDNAKKAHGAIGKMGVGIQEMGKMAMGFATGQLLVGAVDKLASSFMSSVQAASAMTESLSKSRVVFGDAADDLEAFGATAAQSMGLSKQAAIETGATFGNLFVTMGLGQKPAADMSKSLLQLAADLASFNNLNPEDVLGKLRSGLVGETEPMRTLGVNINETTMKAKAMELGFKSLGGELTEAQKVQARYALMLDQTKTAQGDFARTSDGLANSQRIADAELANASAELGKSFVPVMLLATKGALFFAQAIQGWALVFQKAGEGIKWLGDRLGELAGKTAEAAELSTEAGAKAAAGIGKVTATLSNKVQLEWETMQRKSGNALDQISFKFVESLADMQQSHSDKLGRIVEDEAKATTGFQRELTERLDSYNANQVDMQDKHLQALEQINLAEQKATADFTAQAAERKTKWGESMADLATSHARTIDGIKAKMADMQVQFVADANARKAKWAEEESFAPDSYEAAKEGAARKVEELQKRLNLAIGANTSQRDAKLISDLSRRLKEEQYLANLSYGEYMERLKIRHEAEEKAAKDKADKELAVVKTQLAEEDTVFAARTAKLKAEYDKDLEGYRASLTDKQTDLAAKRTEENTEFEKRTTKAKEEYDKDVVNAKAAMDEKWAEFGRRRLDEETALITDMSKRRERYDEDVAAVRTAENDKLDALKERLAAEYAANVEQAIKLRDLVVPGHQAPTPAPPNTGPVPSHVPYQKQAQGGTGFVSQPTMFLAGEAGRESFWFSGANNNVPPPGQSIDYDRLASVLQAQPIVLRIDSEDLVVRGYERARRRGRIA